MHYKQKAYQNEKTLKDFYGPFQNISTTDTINTVTGMFQLAAGDYIELYGYTNGGTGQVIAQYSSYTYLQGMFVRGNAV